MRSFRIKRVAVLPVLALMSLALVLPLASWAASSKPVTAGAPIVITGGIHVTATSVVLEGSVNPRTLATSYYFKYGPTTAYGKDTSSGSLPAGGTTAVKVKETAPGFLSGYHYSLVASNAGGTNGSTTTTEGKDHSRTFTLKTVKKKKDAFVLPKLFEPTPVGGTFTLSGTLTGTGNANRAIVLQASPYPYRTAFANVGAPILTSASGAFSFTVRKLSASTKFRISTVGGVPVYSLIVPAQAQVRVVLKVRASSHKGLVRLYGTVTPAEVGAHVLFQLERPPKAEKIETSEKPGKLEKPGKGSSERSEEKPPTFATKFKTVVKAATRAISRFSMVVSITQAGHYRAFVEIPPGPLVSGHSQSITLSAPTAKKKAKKKKG
ncbi:MAG: hypothetical protein ABSB69_00400 [Solirubrobacteraceae bacterium]